VLADKKKVVSDRDIEALVTVQLPESPDAYKLDRFVINSGNSITSTAIVRLTRGEEGFEEVAIGDGPVDAAYKAIEKIVGSSYTLDEYAIHSVSEGEDALGEVLIKLKDGEELYTGRGLSTDILESSILAYLNALNKIKANA
jgi:2-isopropylmalate synthase